MTVVVVGGGPAGLACAVELRRRGVTEVVVLDREQRAGGIPRHCAHQGFGGRDLRRVLSGPSYARRYVELAQRAGAEVLPETMVTGWSATGALELTSPDGREALSGEVVVLATGCRERPRAARLVPGSRPAGVITTGQLQQLAAGGLHIGTRAVIVGAEHVSFSALLTLTHAGVKVAGMVTDLAKHQSLGVVRAAAAVRYRVPLWTRTAVTEIHGLPRVEEVDLLELDTGKRSTVACDTIVFTGDWIPDQELAVLADIELDPGTRGPRIDTALRTARRGVFAAGNLLHGAEPADVAALGGRHAATAVARWLHDQQEWSEQMVPIGCRAPIHWISPNAISDRLSPPRDRFLLRAYSFLDRPVIEVRQGERRLWSGGVARLGPGRSASLPSSWIQLVEPNGAPIEIAAH